MRHNTIFWFRIALVAVFILSLGNEPRAYGQQGPNRETIIKAWQDRQDRTRSIRVSWVERRTVPKGLLNKMLGRMAALRFKQMGIEPDATVPPADTTYEVPRSICFAGMKARATCEDRQWSGKDQAYVLQSYVVAFDGNVGKHFFPNGSSYTPWPQGIVQSRFPEANASHLMPLFMTFRALAPEYRSLDLETMTPTGRRQLVHDRSCVEWERHRGNFREQMWIDPARGCTMVAYQSMINEQITSKINVQYREDGDCGFVPTQWGIVTFFSDGKFQESVEAKVTDYQVNPEVAASEFEIEFPPGTRVTDLREGPHSLGYIVKESGKKRAVLHEDIGATYEQMLHSEPGEALGKRRPASVFWPLLLASLAAALTGALLVWRKRSLKWRFLRH